MEDSRVVDTVGESVPAQFAHGVSEEALEGMLTNGWTPEQVRQLIEEVRASRAVLKTSAFAASVDAQKLIESEAVAEARRQILVTIAHRFSFPIDTSFAQLPDFIAQFAAVAAPITDRVISFNTNNDKVIHINGRHGQKTLEMAGTVAEPVTTEDSTDEHTKVVSINGVPVTQDADRQTTRQRDPHQVLGLIRQLLTDSGY